MILANSIMECRTKKGISQKELAEQVGVHQTFISHVEKGLKTPTVSMLVAIADVLDCSIDGLLGRDEKYIKK